MNERPLYFGTGRNLLGVLTIPEHPEPGAPAVVLLNAGLLHRVGPNRLHVDLARRLAARGISCLRFDMSGVGDSELQGGGMLDIERTRSETIDAMDALHEMLGTERFVLIGLCTGAFNAFRAALVDERVSGCVLLDGYGYPTLRSRFHHYRRRVFELDRWSRFISRKLGRGRATNRSDDTDLVVFENEVVPKERFGRELSTLIQRNVRLLFVYTALGPLSYYYAEQLQDAFPKIDLERSATVLFYPDADHTFTLPGNRNRLLDEIEAWFGTQFSLAPSGSGSGPEVSGKATTP